MADSTTPQAQSAPAGPTDGRGAFRGRAGRGGRGEGGGGGFRGGFNGIGSGIGGDRGEDRPRGDFGSRGRGRGGERSRGRGRGGRGGARDRAQSQSQATATPGEPDPTSTLPPPQPGGSGVFGARLTKDAANNSITGEPQQQGAIVPAAGAENGDDDAEVCFICASPISHHSVAPCNHRTCHICSLRLRALYKTKACAHCRTDAPSVIFTDEAEKRYEDYTPADFFRKDGNLGIAYEKPEIFEDTVLLLRYNCPDESCDVACMGWPDLHRHVRSVHQKVMCDLCTRNKKVFTHEHELFTQQELRRHEKYGDDTPGAIDQSGFKGHPECGFCRQRFYGDDELYAHCRDKHERCHVCDQRDGGNNPQYYINYEALDQHFHRDHFPCPDQECQEKKFVVFASEMDLKAHQIEAHPNGLTKGRDSRRVDLSNFDYRPQYQEARRGRGGGGVDGERGGRRGGGRGRDPNTEALPAPSGAHLSRAELAHQREREIQSAQTVSSRNFGGRLTQTEPTPAQSARQQQAPQSPRPDAAHPVAPQSPRPAEALTPQEQARRLRHAAVSERAVGLLKNDQLKMTEFRNHISAYRTGTMKPGDLIDAFFALFDTPTSSLGTLIKELADIFEIPSKREDLLKAWADWKAINEDYPTLPGPAGANAVLSAGVPGAGVGGSRVLKLKSSTQQSGRSVNNAPRTWNSAAGAPQGSRSNIPGANYPSLPATKGNAAPAPTPGWLALRPAATSSAGSSARASPVPSRTSSSANLGRATGGTDLFPALPAARKPTSSVFSPGYTGSGVIRSNAVTSGNAWAGGGGSGSGSSRVETPVETEDGDAGGKGKGRKGRKQIVFAWG